MSDKRVYEIPTSVMEKADGSSVTVKDAKARRMLDRKPEINDTTPSATSVYSSQKVEQKLASAVADFVSFSEDQTSRTDAEKEQARDNIGAERLWVKVWENASPTSNFAAQDVLLDLTDVSEIAVLFKCDTSSSAFIDVRYVLSAETDTADGQKAMMSMNGLKVQQRYDCAIKRDKIHFGKGCLFNSYGTRTDGNQYAIPWYIYAR